jgi:hypothetical protein
MSKKFKHRETPITETEKQVEKARNKKGKIKAKKKAAKVLKGMCNHMRPNKKGKRKKLVIPSNKEGYIVCTSCGDYIPGSMINREGFYDRFNPFYELVDQLKFATAYVGANEKDIDFINKFGGMLSMIPKFQKKIGKLVSKSKGFDKKKKRDESTTRYGDWNVKKH